MALLRRPITIGGAGMQNGEVVDVLDVTKPESHVELQLRPRHNVIHIIERFHLLRHQHPALLLRPERLVAVVGAVPEGILIGEDRDRRGRDRQLTRRVLTAAMMVESVAKQRTQIRRLRRNSVVDGAALASTLTPPSAAMPRHSNPVRHAPSVWNGNCAEVL